MDPKLKMGLLLVSSFVHSPFQRSRGESEQLVFAAVASTRFTCSRLLRRSDTNENLDDAAMAIIDYAMDWNMLQGKLGEKYPRRGSLQRRSLPIGLPNTILIYAAFLLEEIVW